MEIQTETKVVRFIECDGIRFYEDQRGYWIGHVEGKRKRLHTYVWEKHNREIPKGYHIHHIDFDTSNNEIDNLVMLKEGEHLSLHGQTEKNKSLARKNVVKYAVPAAREWHGNGKGKEWHREHYEKSLGLLHQQRVTRVCQVCGVEFETDACKPNTKYCSNSCKSMARRKSGVDNVQRICKACGAEFTTSKYSKAQTCSKKCTMRVRFSKG